MTNFARVAWFREIPSLASLPTLEQQLANQAEMAAVGISGGRQISKLALILGFEPTGVGLMYTVGDKPVRYTLYYSGFNEGDLVAFDFKDGSLDDAIRVRQIAIANNNPAVPAATMAQIQQQLDKMLADQADGKFPQIAVNVRRAMMVPSFKLGRITGWTYREFDQAVADSVARALAGRAAEGYVPPTSQLPWRG